MSENIRASVCAMLLIAAYRCRAREPVSNPEERLGLYAIITSSQIPEQVHGALGLAEMSHMTPPGPTVFKSGLGALGKEKHISILLSLQNARIIADQLTFSLKATSQ